MGTVNYAHTTSANRGQIWHPPATLTASWAWYLSFQLLLIRLYDNHVSALISIIQYCRPTAWRAVAYCVSGLLRRLYRPKRRRQLHDSCRVTVTSRSSGQWIHHATVAATARSDVKKSRKPMAKNGEKWRCSRAGRHYTDGHYTGGGPPAHHLLFAQYLLNYLPRTS